MDELVKAVVTALIGYGLPGIVIIGLCFIVYIQRQDIASQREEIKASYEARRQDALSSQQVVRDNTEAMVKIREATIPEILTIKSELRELRLVRKSKEEISGG